MVCHIQIIVDDDDDLGVEADFGELLRDFQALPRSGFADAGERDALCPSVAIQVDDRGNLLFELVEWPGVGCSLQRAGRQAGKIVHDPRVFAMGHRSHAHPVLLLFARALVTDHFAVRALGAQVVQRDLAFDDDLGIRWHHEIVGMTFDDFDGSACESAGYGQFVHGPFAAVSQLTGAAHPNVGVRTQSD